MTFTSAIIQTAGVVALLTGCATIRIEPAGQDFRVDQYWGVLAVTVGEPGVSHVAEVTALGLARSPFGWSAGYSHQTWAALGPECRLVISLPSPDVILARNMSSVPGLRWAMANGVAHGTVLNSFHGVSIRHRASCSVRSHVTIPYAPTPTQVIGLSKLDQLVARFRFKQPPRQRVRFCCAIHSQVQ